MYLELSVIYFSGLWKQRRLETQIKQAVCRRQIDFIKKMINRCVHLTGRISNTKFYI